MFQHPPPRLYHALSPFDGSLYDGHLRGRINSRIVLAGRHFLGKSQWILLPYGVKKDELCEIVDSNPPTSFWWSWCCSADKQ